MKPKISVIIPVYREEKIIRPTLRHLGRAIGSRDVEIIVVDGQDGGSTIRAIPDCQTQKIISPPGRAIQMNHGARAASGDILIFLHADTRVPLNAMCEILSVIHTQRAAAGAFTLRIDAPGRIYRFIEAMVRARTRITNIPYGDQAIFIKKAVFHHMGGYPEIPIMEDVALMQRLKKQRRKVVIVHSAVTTSARRWEKEGVLYCTIRNRLLSMLFSAGIAPATLARLYP